MSLTKRQTEQIDALKSGGYTSPLTRADLKTAVDDGLIKWPSWITSDTARRLDRGVFDVPELGDHNDAPASVTPKAVPSKTAKVSKPAPDAPDAPTLKTMASTVETVSGNQTFQLAGGSMVPDRSKIFVATKNFKDFRTIIKSERFFPVFITGLSGNGKTFQVEQVCAQLKRELFRCNITKQTDEDDLLGGFRLVDGETVWQNGPVVEAMLRGAVLLLDEVDLASANIMCLQPVLEGKGIFLKKISKWITPADGFQVVATANTKGKGSDDGQFMGTNVLNEAFLDRFPFTFEQEYPTESQEKKILGNVQKTVGLDDPDFSACLVKWAWCVRDAFKEGAVEEIITTRRLVRITEAFSIFGDKRKAIDGCISRFDDDTREAFVQLYEKCDASFLKAAADAADESSSDFFNPADDDIVLTRASYEDRQTARELGCRWSGAIRRWHTTGKNYKANRAEFEKYPTLMPWVDNTISV